MTLNLWRTTKQAVKDYFSPLSWLFDRHDERFPKEIKGHWYCGRWFQNKLEVQKMGLPEGTILNDRPVIDYERCGIVNADTSGLIDGLIPAYRVDGYVGLYKVTGISSPITQYYDGAPWDDGKLIDLQYVRTAKI